MKKLLEEAVVLVVEAARDAALHVHNGLDRALAQFDPDHVVVNGRDLELVLDQNIMHQHVISGVWNDDNPGTAGKPCEECAARKRLRQAVDDL